MTRALRVLLILLLFELGVLVAIFPWSPFWERNYFLERYPGLIPYLLNPFLRGAVSGLGLVDIALAWGMIRRRSPQQAETPS
jgi:hypothetical protein